MEVCIFSLFNFTQTLVTKDATAQGYMIRKFMIEKKIMFLLSYMLSVNLLFFYF